MKNKVSVLMSVYKGEIEYFKAAIKSIQDQTYENWELIIINDGDIKNDSYYRQCINEFSDKRIIYISNTINQGISACLNQALQVASGDFIAKMDSDDISLSTRFEKQVQYFNSHLKCNVLGTYAIAFGDVYDYLIDYNNYSQKMRSILLMFRNSGLIHPSVMVRSEFLKINGIKYDEHFKKALDYRLWVECTKYSKIDCLNEILFLYRRHFSQISTSGKIEQDKYRDEIRILQLRNLLEQFSKSEKKLHLRLCERNNTESDIKLLYGWCNRLVRANRKKNIYDQFLFKGLLFSESLTIVYKWKRKLGLKRFCKYFFQFISIECLSMLIYSKCINISNNIRKHIVPIFKKKKIQNINNVYAIIQPKEKYV